VTTDGAPLDGLTVRERTGGLAATYAGHLLAGLGAGVHRDGASPFPILDRRKRPDAAVGRTPGATVADEASEPDDAPIACTVRAWGRTGPRLALPPDEALVQAATGVHTLQWSWSGRPVWLVTPVVSYMTGMLAALGVAAAHFARVRGASGGERIGVSGLQGALALNGGTYVTGPSHASALLVGGDPRGVYPSYSLYPTADGWIFIGALTQTFWVKLVTFLERIDLLVDERLQGNPLTFGAPELRAFVRRELEPIFARRTTAAWVTALRAADIPCGAVQTRREFLDDPEVRASGLVAHPWEPPPAARVTAGAPASLAPARPGRTCLDGIRVLDLTSFIAGPVCPMLLADLGADVVKIESFDGDPFRMTAYGFHGWNRGKRSLVLDLKRPEGRDVFLDLARGADVVVENFRGGVMTRLGLDAERLAAVNPGLVVVSISGAEGALASLPGFDPVFQARSGFMRAQGGSHEPVFHTIAYNDYSAGALGALAVVAALVARERRKRGQRVEVSLMRTALVDQAAHMTDPTGGGRDYLGPTAARRLYACGDGWICVAAGTAAQAGTLGALARISIAPATPADGPEADAVAAALARLPRAAALERLAAAEVPAAPCLAFPEMLGDEHLRANRSFVTLDDPALGPVTLGGPLVDLETMPIAYRRLGPGLGAHSRVVLDEIGYDEARVAALLAADVVRA
jgi:crotonobetainyl-CoA:carnitine CoA-transferase CaiB-like acyl-CoA transferase